MLSLKFSITFLSQTQKCYSKSLIQLWWSINKFFNSESAANFGALNAEFIFYIGLKRQVSKYLKFSIVTSTESKLLTLLTLP